MISTDVTRLPTTWAGAAYLRHYVPRLLLGYLDAEMAVALWIGFGAAAERAIWESAQPGVEAPPVKEYIDFYKKRIFGFDNYGVARVFFDGRSAQLVRLDPDGAARRVLIKGVTISARAHLHELRSSQSYRLNVDRKLGTIIELDGTAYSIWNKAMGGSRRALAILGLPIVESIDYPAAFLDDGVRLADDGLVEIRRVNGLRDADDQFDVVAYFEDLRARGLLPFDTEEDVRRFVVALALPLIRFIATGLLGVIWVLGPPGAGKDFVCELAPDMWRHAMASPTSKSKFDLDGGRDELELKRCLSQAGGAVYGRAKEAAKRGEGFTTAMIRLGGTDQVAARAMRQDEIEIANTYTILADSAEDIPDRREIYRRTLTIRVRRLDDDALGAARAEVMAKAPEIIASLKRLIEKQTPEYFTQQSRTSGRPTGQVAMARLFGCNLDAVVGRNLDEIWEALNDYSASMAAVGEIDAACNKLRSDKRAPEDIRKALSPPNPMPLSIYRMSAFMKAASDRLSIHHLFFAPFKSTAGVVNLIKRETDLDRDVREHGYLRVEIDGAQYALRLLRDDRFVLWMPESDYRTAMGLQPVPPNGEHVAPPPPVEVNHEAVAAARLDAMVASVLPHIPARPS
jgi:hypothetical protein